MIMRLINDERIKCVSCREVKGQEGQKRGSGWSP